MLLLAMQHEGCISAHICRSHAQPRMCVQAGCWHCCRGNTAAAAGLTCRSPWGYRQGQRTCCHRALPSWQGALTTAPALAQRLHQMAPSCPCCSGGSRTRCSSVVLHTAGSRARTPAVPQLLAGAQHAVGLGQHGMEAAEGSETQRGTDAHAQCLECNATRFAMPDLLRSGAVWIVLLWFVSMSVRFGWD